MPRRKNYTNHHRQGVNFLIKDQVYRQATSLKGTKHFRVKGKLTLRFNNPSEITSRRGVDSYQLELPPELPDVHNAFHASQPRKCFQLPNLPDHYEGIGHRAIDP